MGLVILDSSFVIALAQPTDKHHKKAKSYFVAEQRYVISAITATEFMSGVSSERLEERSWTALNLMIHQILDVGADVARKAAAIRRSTGLKTPDAIISATAQISKAQLWTFDTKLAKATPGARLLA